MAHSEMELSLSRSQLDATTLTFESLQGNDVKILYYTGIPNWEIFLVVFGYVRSDLSEKCRLSQFQQLLMTLMRLRHNFPLQDLGYHLSVHMSTISRVVNHVIDVLYVKLKPLILWPECDVLLRTMPMCFCKHCPTCIVIIDCFEIFSERPSNLLAVRQ